MRPRQFRRKFKQLLRRQERKLAMQLLPDASRRVIYQRLLGIVQLSQVFVDSEQGIVGLVESVSVPSVRH